MKPFIVVILLAASTYSFAQNQYSPFVGGFEIGIGYSNFIDFNRENNIKYKYVELESLAHMVSFIPYQLGLISNKYLDKQRYLEFGLILRKSSVSYVKYHPGGRSIPGINLLSIDVPFRYYFPVGKKNSDKSLFVGLVPAWIISPSVLDGRNKPHLSEEHFRKAYLSVCAGLSKEMKNTRLKIHAGIATHSVIKPTYKTDVPEDIRQYGTIIIPVEILVSWAYILK